MKRPLDVSAATHTPGRLPVKEVCGLRHYSIKPENVTIVAICNFRDKEIDVFFLSSEHGNGFFFCFC